MPAGRPSTYCKETADRIVEGIAQGNSLVSILKEDDELPSYPTVMRWLRENLDFQAMYARAREDQADHDADKIGDIAERVAKGQIEPNAARVAIDAYKWAAGKRKPRVYGEKVMVGGSEDMAPIQTTTKLDISGLTLEQLDALGAALQNAVKPDGQD